MSRRTLIDGTDAAGWIDPASRCRQRTGFIGAAGRRLYATLHLPAAPPAGGVVVCSPLFVEAERNYRREVLLGRRLAELGVACIRFHYRGTGNSDWLDVVDLCSMAEDATTASEELTGLGVDSLAAVGTRIGAHTAAGLAGAWSGAPLALWEPVVHPSKWVREVRRTSRIAALTDHRGPVPPRGGTDAPVEAVGYLVHGSAFSGVHELEPPVGSPVLLVRLGRETALTHGFEDFASRWSTDGREVRIATFVLDEPWWFLDHGWTAAEESRQDTGLCAMTAHWLADHLSR